MRLKFYPQRLIYAIPIKKTKKTMKKHTKIDENMQKSAKKPCKTVQIY